MNLKTLSMMGALLLLAGTGANAQKKQEVLNDSNTPLHLLQPAYKVPYGMLNVFRFMVYSLYSFLNS